jgi:hypothetical protein
LLLLARATRFLLLAGGEVCIMAAENDKVAVLSRWGLLSSMVIVAQAGACDAGYVYEFKSEWLGEERSLVETGGVDGSDTRPPPEDPPPEDPPLEEPPPEDLG